MHDYLKELNEPQLEAVVNYNGASLVIAGAGSGKTRVLTYRIAHLLANNVPAYNILALTFTNKAAAEMKQRIAKMVGPDIARNLWMGTFHSIFARILRIESAHLGYTSDFTIYDSIDSKSMIKKIIKELNLDDKIYKPSEIYGRISSAKNNLVTAKAYSSNNQILIQDQKNNKARIADIFTMYANRCKKANAMDFDDLLLNTNILFRDFPEVLAKYQNLYKYILVDEYQDTNFAQYLIVNKLGAKYQNICVVGDDAQSIYAFRGAKIENILNFKNDYKNYILYKLEQNYRSTQTIVNAANSIIKQNKEQIPKKVFSTKEIGEKIVVLETETDKDEAFRTAKIIQDTILERNLEYKDFAVLYRTNAQSRSFEEAFRRFSIPYKVYGSISFYQRKEIKDILGYFRLAINHNDEESLDRIINYPARGLGQTTLTKLAEFAEANNISIWVILENLDKVNLGFNTGTKTKLEQFRNLIKHFSQLIQENDAYEAALTIAKESGIINEFKNAETHEDQTRFENLEELLNGIKEFVDDFGDQEGMPTLNRFMENVALLTNQDNDKEDDFNKVTIMTIHSAKGLEFKFVFIVGLEEELFPSNMSSSTQKELEEERRLFYVALTRAEQSAVLSYAKERYKWGTPTSCRPSRFIKEIDEQYLELPDSFFEKPISFSNKDDDFGFSSKPRFFKPRQNESKGPTPLASKKLLNLSQAQKKQPEQNDNFVPDDPSQIKEGMIVRHSKFGLGEIVKIEGSLPNSKAVVHFEIVGEKQLLLKFAKLQIVSD
ncbi:MAG: ATP-dependent helicase [Bacteroidales bacterium]